MAKVIAVRDTETGVSAEVTVESLTELAGEHITSFSLTADGRPLVPADLLILEALGLRLPTSGAAAVPAPAPVLPAPRASAPAVHPKPAEPAEVRASASKDAARAVVKAAAPKPAKPPKPAKAAKAVPVPAKAVKSAVGSGAEARAAKAAQNGARPYRLAPPPEELQKLMVEHGGPTGVADALGAPRHSVTSWLRRYRQQGIEFPTAEGNGDGK